MRVSGVERDSVVDGPGLRDVIFIQGCFHDCPGCHNPETHPLTGGEETDIPQLLRDLYQKDKLIDGFTFSGGDPLHFLHMSNTPERLEYILELGKAIKLAQSLTGNVVCYTGYTWKYLQRHLKLEPSEYFPTIISNFVPIDCPVPYYTWLVNTPNIYQEQILQILTLSNYWITEPFIRESKTIEMPFRGSTNQKVLALDYTYSEEARVGTLRLMDMSFMWNKKLYIESNKLLRYYGFCPDQKLDRCTVF